MQYSSWGRLGTLRPSVHYHTYSYRLTGEFSAYFNFSIETTLRPLASLCTQGAFTLETVQAFKSLVIGS